MAGVVGVVMAWLGGLPLEDRVDTAFVIEFGPRNVDGSLLKLCDGFRVPFLLKGGGQTAWGPLVVWAYISKECGSHR
jgi:hypothetical protein